MMKDATQYKVYFRLKEAIMKHGELVDTEEEEASDIFSTDEVGIIITDLFARYQSEFLMGIEIVRVEKIKSRAVSFPAGLLK